MRRKMYLLFMIAIGASIGGGVVASASGFDRGGPEITNDAFL